MRATGPKQTLFTIYVTFKFQTNARVVCTKPSEAPQDREVTTWQKKRASSREQQQLRFNTEALLYKPMPPF